MLDKTILGGKPPSWVLINDMHHQCNAVTVSSLDAETAGLFSMASVILDVGWWTTMETLGPVRGASNSVVADL